MTKRLLVLAFFISQIFLPPMIMAQEITFFAPEVSSDTNSTTGTINVYTSGTGPVIAETTPGQIAGGTLTVNIPGNYIFNPNATVSVRVTGDSDPSKNINGVASGNLIPVSSLTISQASININQPGQNGIPNTLTFQGLEVRPTMGIIMHHDVSQLYFTGSSISGTSVTNTYLRQVAGKPVTFIGFANDTMVTHSGTPFKVQVFAQDAYHNFATVLTDIPFILALKQGAGQIFGTLSGVIPAGTTNGTVPSVFYTIAELNILLSITALQNPEMTPGEVLFSSLQGTNPIDTTPPVTTDNTDDLLHNQTVTITLSCSDNLAGCSDTYYTTDGSTPNTNSPSGTTISLTDEGVYTLKYFSIDHLGNHESVKTAANQIKIEKSAPTASPTPQPTPSPTVSPSPSDTPTPIPSPIIVNPQPSATPSVEVPHVEKEQIEPIVMRSPEPKTEILGIDTTTQIVEETPESFWQELWNIIWDMITSRVRQFIVHLI